jgi:hypothetical protein
MMCEDVALQQVHGMLPNVQLTLEMEKVLSEASEQMQNVLKTHRKRVTAVECLIDGSIVMSDFFDHTMTRSMKDEVWMIGQR